jgi:hypothetical protein
MFDLWLIYGRQFKFSSIHYYSLFVSEIVSYYYLYFFAKALGFTGGCRRNHCCKMHVTLCFHVAVINKQYWRKNKYVSLGIVGLSQPLARRTVNQWSIMSVCLLGQLSEWLLKNLLFHVLLVHAIKKSDHLCTNFALGTFELFFCLVGN